MSGTGWICMDLAYRSTGQSFISRGLGVTACMHWSDQPSDVCLFLEAKTFLLILSHILTRWLQVVQLACST